MKGLLWLCFFAIDVSIDLLAVFFQWDGIRMISKPLIVIILSCYLILYCKQKNGQFFFLILALFFSLAGDISLLFSKTKPDWFLPGLCNFLMAHVFYIVFFTRIRKNNPSSPGIRWQAFLLILAIITFLFLRLAPGLRTLEVPVLVYSIALGWMTLAAISAFDLTTQKPGRICVCGALLFLLSDSLLALDKFYRHFPFAEPAVMLSYSLAQLFIVWGSIRYMESVNNN